MPGRVHYIDADAAERQRREEHDDLRRRVEIIELKMERAGLRGSTMDWSRVPEEQDRFRDEYWARMRRLAEIDKRLKELEANGE